MHFRWSLILQVLFACALAASFAENAAANPLFGYEVETDIVFGTGRVIVDGEETARNLELDNDHKGHVSISDIVKIHFNHVLFQTVGAFQ